MRRAFTLIELLVVIAIIALLIGILLPSLSSSRRMARGTVGFANLRTVGTMLHAYVNDHRESFLNPFRAQWPDDPRYSGMTFTMTCEPSDPSQRWDFAVPPYPCAHTRGFSGVWYSSIRSYRNGARGDLEGISPADADLVSEFKSIQMSGDMDGSVLYPTSFTYPPAFWLRHQYFEGCLGVPTPEDIRTAELAEVYYPSAKVMLFERMDFMTRREPLAYSSPAASTHVMLVDGSADRINMGSLYQSAAGDASLVPLIDCCAPPGAPSQVLPFFSATRYGARGRDLPR